MIGSHTTPERYGEQLFNAARAGEADRLTSLAAAFDPYSQEVLSSLEIQPHWQCLDVGAGPGTVAIWLARQLGPDGEVVALDLDTRHLEHHAHPRLRVQQADLTDPGFDPGRFDLVHARFLLMPVMTADSPFNQFWRLTLGQAAPRLLASGLVDAATLKATLDYLASPGTHELSLAMCTAIGHRPA